MAIKAALKIALGLVVFLSAVPVIINGAQMIYPYAGFLFLVSLGVTVAFLASGELPNLLLYSTGILCAATLLTGGIGHGIPSTDLGSDLLTVGKATNKATGQATGYFMKGMSFAEEESLEYLNETERDNQTKKTVKSSFDIAETWVGVAGVIPTSPSASRLAKKVTTKKIKSK